MKNKSKILLHNTGILCMPLYERQLLCSCLKVGPVESCPGWYPRECSFVNTHSSASSVDCSEHIWKKTSCESAWKINELAGEEWRVAYVCVSGEICSKYIFLWGSEVAEIILTMCLHTCMHFLLRWQSKISWMYCHDFNSLFIWK